MRKGFLSFFNLFALVAIGAYYLALYLWPADPKNPSGEYYVNDYAQAFSSASTDYFLRKSTEVAERTSAKELGAFQIVNATYAYPEGASETYDKTDLFRRWGIGENDMGLLLLYSYRLQADGGLSLFKSEVEVGYRLSGYLTAGALGTLSDQAFLSVTNWSDLYHIECAQAQFFAQILSHVLPEAYGISVTPFDPLLYQDYLINYNGKAYPPSRPVSQWDYVFSYGGNFFWAFGFPLVFIGLFLAGDGLYVVGRGGSSGGGGISRLFH
jgi:hypothetical protein